MDFDDSSVSSEGPETTLQSTASTSSSSSSVSGVAEPGAMVRERLQSLVNDAAATTVTRSGGAVQSMQFEVGYDDGFDDMLVVKRMPEYAQKGENGEYLHHQLFSSVSEGVRPLARHGCSVVTGEGRLGGPIYNRNKEMNDHNDTDSNDNDDDDDAADRAMTDEDGERMACDTVPVEDAKDWDTLLGPMALVDVTLLSRLYLGYKCCLESGQDEGDEPMYERETMLKVISPFFTTPETPLDAETDERQCMAIATLQRLASKMCSMQRALEQAGMTFEGQQEQQRQRQQQKHSAADGSDAEDGAEGHVDLRQVICRGVHSVHVDSSCRLVGVVDVEDCAVSLSDVIAFCSRPFSQQEVVAVIKSVVWKVGQVHEAGFVHGCLHSGNILCSTDDGRIVLTGLCGIMSNPLLPSDPSYISPRRAAAMRPLVDLVWNHEEEAINGDLSPWASNLTFHRALLEIYGCVNGAEMAACPRDDVYAIGIVTLSCLLGVPPFHAVTLKELVDVLAPLHDCETNGSPPSLVGAVFASRYAVQRFMLAGYAEDFIKTAHDFVEVCLSAGTDDATELPNTAGDLLQHAFFTSYPIIMRMNSRGEDGSVTDDEEGDEGARVDQVLHFLVYPIFSLMECAKKDCGTPPLLPRLYRNSIFASRLDALRCSPLCDSVASASGCNDDRNTLEDETGNSIGVLWPYLGKEAPHWASGPYYFNKAFWDSLLYRCPDAAVPCFSQQEGDGSVGLKAILEAKGMRMDVEAHTIIYSEKVKERLVLHGEEMPGDYREWVNTLILRGLDDCVVEILLGFRFILLLNVRRCKLLLGPCYCCYCDGVFDCNPVAVASTNLLVNNIFNMGMSLGGCTVPRWRGAKLNWGRASIVPYIVAYAGMSADFAALSVPQEHAENVYFFEDESDLQDPPKRTIKLCNTLRGGYDYPYSHAVAAYGNRFAHEDDGVSDLFLYFSELEGRSVHIARIRGGGGGGGAAAAAPPPPNGSDARNKLDLSAESTHMSAWPSRQREASVGLRKGTMVGEKNVAHFPVIFILDVVGDCVIEDCSRCTVFVMGSSECVTVRRCSQMRLFFMAKEGYFENCEAMEVYALVTELLFLDHCHDMEFSPLAVRAPYVEEIIGAIVGGCADEQLHEVLENALRMKDLEVLNVLLRAGSDANAIDLTACEAVNITTAAVPMFLVDFSPTEAPLSTFFDEAHCGEDVAIMPFLQHIWGSSDEREAAAVDTAAPLVRLHDLVNVSIFRIPDTLIPGSAASEPSLVDVILERIVLGAVHLADAVGTLFIRNCTGPLEIAVCAATHVVMESCEHVTLHVACRTFTARACSVCQTALHVNTPPRYDDCISMHSSTLSIVSEKLDLLLERAGVQREVNLFDKPLLPVPVDDVLSKSAAEDGAHINSLEDALALLHRVITFVPPLSPICVDGKDARLISCLEDRINREKVTRSDFDTAVTSALLFLSRRQPELPVADASLETTTIEVGGARRNSESVRDASWGERCIVHPYPPTSSASTKVPVQHVDPFSCCVDDDYEDDYEEGGGKGEPMVPAAARCPQSPDSGVTDVRDESLPCQSKRSSKGASVGSGDGKNQDGEDVDNKNGSGFSNRDADDDAASERELEAEDSSIASMEQQQNPTEASCLCSAAPSSRDSMAKEASSMDGDGNDMDLVTHRSAVGGGEPLMADLTNATQVVAPALHASCSAGKDETVDYELHLDRCQPQTDGDDVAPPEHAAMREGEFQYNDLIIGIHPDEEAAVSSVMRRVTAGCEALLHARRVSSSSLKDLQRRIKDAVQLIRRLSK